MRINVDYPAGMIERFESAASSRTNFRRASRWVLGLFWLLQFMALTSLSVAEGGSFAVQSIKPRVVVLVAGFLLMLGFVEIVARFERKSFGTRLVLTIAWSMLLCVVLVTINFGAFFILYGRQNDEAFRAVPYIETALTWTWFCVSVSGALLALSYNLEMRDRERSLAAMRAVAGRAQLAALRYQLNPHFLFNTLNSVASLVARHDNAAAELMVENLADFLRATLELDPHEDVPLEREIELQRMYLAVEQVRFPERLLVRFEIPDGVERLRVPALITQPLVENAIRHAVACTPDPVTVRLAAALDAGRLVIVVEDDARPARSAPKGTGYGLRNVRERLEGRFGADQSVVAGIVPSGGFRVEVTLPALDDRSAD